ncbi:MAG: CoA activase, partial [Deltaproteobacteria bacterium]|nr:CoA activase [Deltaproteobacteria bacterium]
MHPEVAARGEGEGDLFLGLDLGSVSVDTVVVDQAGEILRAEYTRTRGRPLEATHQALERVLAVYPAGRFRALAVTGTGAPHLGRLLGAREINEIIAAARGVAALAPQTRTIIDMGGEDAKMILVSPDGRGGLRIDDFAMNTMCAAGTGSFLDQQSHRLQLTIEEFSQVAMQSQNPPRLAGRCSVFAKSDMIHLQQEATPDYDIVAGLCFAMARNLKSNIAKGKTIAPPVCFIGGVAANQGVHRALIDIMGLKTGELIVPQHHGCVGALGAALTARDLGLDIPLPELGSLADAAAQAGATTRRQAPLTLDARHQTPPPAVAPPAGPLTGYLGVDVGSISTNVVVIDQNLNVLSKQYLLTSGRPLEAVKEGLRRVGQEIGDRLTILGAGTTGSGRYLTADFIGADLVRNEITAQATAAAAIDPEVDTIFEIGGQDSKYISLKDGAIVDFMMNKVCAAGTGSFLEEQAEKLGINIKEEFGRRALAAPRPVRLGERCTVFMESDLVAQQAGGAELDDLVAGLSYSIVHNYLNKVVEDRPVGKKIFYQGATAANKGIVAAFEAVLGRPITVPAYHDVTGAIGAAILALRERDWEASRFKGFGVAETGYQITTFECGGCPNTCSVRRVTVEGEKRPLFYGSRCEKYEVDARAKTDHGLPDLVAEREEMLLSYVQTVPDKHKRGEIGVPRTMIFRDMLPFFATFLARLGFQVVLSGPSTKKLIHKGVEAMVNEPCFPMKVAHGHLADLLAQGVEQILLPAVVNLAAPGHPTGFGQVCPYNQTLPYTAPAALNLSRHSLVTAPLHFGFGPDLLRRDLMTLVDRLGVDGFHLKPALEAGLAAQEDFTRRLKERGARALDGLAPGQEAMVIVSRPYNGMDPGLNLGLPGKMQNLGVLALPLDMLDLDAVMGHPELAEMYWRYGQKILAAGLLTRQDPRLHAVYITNFGCGPDSFIGHFFRRIMEGKPFLEIEIDEHSADVGAITRLEAFLDSLKN